MPQRIALTGNWSELRYHAKPAELTAAHAYWAHLLSSSLNPPQGSKEAADSIESNLKLMS